VKLTVPSFAKTNWTLEILGKRSDGFHELLTLLQTLDLRDHLSFEVPRGNITLATEGRKVTNEADNLIQTAAHFIKEKAGTDQGVHIELSKRIPVGSGLGGGSSNAAITLLALNQLWECQLSLYELLQMAGEIGSDVPFFLTGGTGLGSGRGERVHLLPDLSREFSVLLYCPRFQVPAAEAYAGLKMRPGKLTRPELNTTIRRFQEVLEAGNWNILRNDLEGPVFSRYPLLAEKKRELLAAGCEFGMLSGSGSALVGISSSDSLRMAKEKLVVSDDAEIILCRTLSRKQYFDRLKKAGIQVDRFSF
jgi:4-diphosphocytidyl-2-C-methyl-D-erythritol kinase